METIIATSVLGLLCLLAEIFNGRKILGPMVLLGLLGILVWNFVSTDSLVQVYTNSMFASDPYSVAFSGLLIFFSLLILVLGGNYYKNIPQHWSDFLSIFLFTLCGSLILTGYTNLIMLFLGIEILSISLYIMAGSNKSNLESNEAGMKYFLMGSFASGILLFGIAMIYGATGSFDLQQIQLANLQQGVLGAPLLICGVILLLVGMFFKVSAAPFHFWSPDVYQGSPTIVTAFMATVAKLSAIIGFYRLVAMGFPSFIPQLEMIFMVVIVMTICTGNIIALVQDNVKRMLAFSGISHAGYMLLAILAVPVGDSSQLFYYALGYGAANIAAFAVAIPVFNAMKTKNIDTFNGLIRKNPFLAIVIIIALLSMASIPPFAGFWAKYFIFTSAIDKGYLPITIIGIINTLFGVYYYFRLIAAMLLKPADGTEVKQPLSYSIVAVIAISIVIAAGVIPGIVLSLF